MNSIELIDHWKQHLRNSRATSLRQWRKWKKLDSTTLSNYFEGKAQATNEALLILEHIKYYEERFNGNG